MSKTPDFDIFSDEDLVMLNHAIIATLKERQGKRERQELRRFSVDQPVSFQGPEGGPLSGRIVRVNQKTLTIATEHGLWRIDPDYVVKEKTPKRDKGQILKLHRPN